jgi:hypothetical protein
MKHKLRYYYWIDGKLRVEEHMFDSFLEAEKRLNKSKNFPPVDYLSFVSAKIYNESEEVIYEHNRESYIYG